MLNLVLTLSLLIFLVSPRLTAGEEVIPSPVATGEDMAAPAAGEVVEAAGVEEEERVTCLWKSILPDPDFQPEDGDSYRITVTGSDRENLSFSYRRLKTYQGEARIAVHTRNTSDNRVLVDQENSGLFAAETGEFTLSLIVPPGWPLYLVEDPGNPYADPVVLSNIVELP